MLAFGDNFLATITILTLLIISYALGMDIYLPGIPAIRETFATSQFSVQLTLSVFVLTGAVGQLFLGPLSEWIGRKNVIIISGIIFSLGSLLCALSVTVSMLIIFRFIEAIGACGLYVCSVTVIRDLYTGENVTRAYSVLNAMAGTSPLLAPAVGSIILVFFNWRMIFFILFFYGVGITLLSGYEMHETLKPGNQRFNVKIFLTKFHKVLQNRQLRFYLHFSAIGNTIIFTLFSVSPYIFINRLHISSTQFGFYFAAISVVYLMGSIMTAVFAKYIGTLRTVIFGSALLFVGSLVLLIWNLIEKLNFTQYYISVAVVAFSIGILTSAGNGGALQPFDESAGFANAVINAINLFTAFLLTTLIMLFPATSIVYLAVCLTTFSLYLAWHLMLNFIIRR